MGDKKTLAMARKELEEMYEGVADDSVNLSFQDLAQVMHKNAEKKKPSPSSTMETISESGPSENIPATLAKLPSLDFSRALQEASLNDHYHHHYHQGGNLHRPHGHSHHHHHEQHHHVDVHSHHAHQHQHQHQLVDVHSHHAHDHHGAGFRPPAAMEQRSFTYDDMSHVSSMSSVAAYGQERGRDGRRRRQGIPHSNICTTCFTYIYIFRHRCLVCGRVYCRQCVSIGMGEMKEGRKCIDCLGRRFSQRYIKKAGNVGCCLGYPSTVKQQELKWAEKGPRTSGEAVYHHRGMVAPSPRTTALPPPTPTTPHHSNPPSFIAKSPHSHTSHLFLPL